MVLYRFLIEQIYANLTYEINHINANNIQYQSLIWI